MKKSLFQFIVGLLLSINLHAQTGIGTSTPDASAKLEISASNKGFLPPRVQLTATNVASPITSPANGLMVFNTVTAGASLYQVVPGYYYWDGVGLKWVSLSTTVGNVQNQAIFRSTASTASGGTAISSWDQRFNNIAAGDLTVNSNTTFTLSNGYYKLEWALPYQPANNYNIMRLQEYSSSTWGTFLNNDQYSSVANGGGSDYGGGTFAADIVDCSSNTRTFRFINPDGAGRSLYSGATFTITKLNPSSSTSTTADNLGNHIATNNIQLNSNYLSNDGGNEGIRIDNSGNVGIGTTSPTSYASNTLQVNGASSASIKITNTASGVGNADGLDLYQGLTDSYLWNRNNGMMSFGTNNGERMRITNGGNVGIGTASPVGLLNLYGGDANAPAILTLESNTGGGGNTGLYFRPYQSVTIANSNPAQAAILGLDNNYSAHIQFWTKTEGAAANSMVERMRITSGGNLLLGTTTQFGSGKLNVAYVPGATTGISFMPSNDVASPTPLIFLNAAGAAVGYIGTNASVTSYNSSSDYRLKEKLHPMIGALNRVMQLKPVTYSWKADGSKGEGFIAHELQAVAPLAVTGKKDAVDEKGKPIYQSIDPSKIVGLLTAAMQEQQAQIDALKKQVMQLRIFLVKKKKLKEL